MSSGDGATERAGGEDSRRGLSRRQMIRASAVAGAAAWTAPVIIDSLSSPAAAGSVCHKKYFKLTTGYGTYGGCCDLNPSCGSGYTSANTRDSGESNLCSHSGCGGVSSNSLAATLAPSGTYTSYYKVTLPGTCSFQPTSFTNSWQVVGNTAVNGTCTNMTGQATDTGAPAVGNGYYVTNGTVAYIKKTAASDFIYLQYCCST